MSEKIMFSVGDYDKDGDLTDGRRAPGVYLHFGETRVKVCNTVGEFPQVLEQIQAIDKEIKENPQ